MRLCKLVRSRWVWILMRPGRITALPRSIILSMSASVLISSNVPTWCIFVPLMATAPFSIQCSGYGMRYLAFKIVVIFYDELLGVGFLLDQCFRNFLFGLGYIWCHPFW